MVPPSPRSPNICVFCAKPDWLSSVRTVSAACTGSIPRVWRPSGSGCSSSLHSRLLTRSINQARIRSRHGWFRANQARFQARQVRFQTSRVRYQARQIQFHARQKPARPRLFSILTGHLIRRPCRCLIPTWCCSLMSNRAAGVCWRRFCVVVVDDPGETDTQSRPCDAREAAGVSPQLSPGRLVCQTAGGASAGHALDCPTLIQS